VTVENKILQQILLEISAAYILTITYVLCTYYAYSVHKARLKALFRSQSLTSGSGMQLDATYHNFESPTLDKNGQFRVR